MTWKPELCRVTEKRMSRRLGVYLVRCELPADHFGTEHEAAGEPFAGARLTRE